MNKAIAVAGAVLLLAGCTSSPTVQEVVTPSATTASAAPLTEPTPSPTVTQAPPTPTDTPTATTQPSAKVFDAEALCDSVGDLVVDAPILSAAPLDVAMGAEYRTQVATARAGLKDFLREWRWLELSTDPGLTFQAAMLPSGIRRQYMRLGIYGRDIKRFSADGSLGRVDRLELEASGREIDDELLSMFDGACS